MLKVTFSGNLGSDPEQRYMPDGKSIVTIRVAVGTRRKVGDEWEDHTDWFRVKAMRSTERLMDRLKKGMRVFVTGTLQIDEFTRSDGSRGTGLDVWADEVDFVIPRGESGDQGERQPVAASAGASRSAQRRNQDAMADQARDDDEAASSDGEDLPF